MDEDRARFIARPLTFFCAVVRQISEQILSVIPRQSSDTRVTKIIEQTARETTIEIRRFEIPRNSPVGRMDGAHDI